MGSEKRRDRRYRFQMPATLVRGKKSFPVLTGDVGFRGALLRTDAPPPLRELVLIQFELPPGGEPLEVHAMAVWNVPPGRESRTPGVGVQFYAVPVEVQKRWNEFIRWVSKHHPEAEVKIVPPAPGVPDPVHRHFERFEVGLPAQVTSPDGTEALTTRYVSRGGAFLRTARAFEPGAELQLVLSHPGTGAQVATRAVVRYRERDPARAGVGVEFVGLLDGKRDEIMRMVSAALGPEPVEVPIVVAPDDPLLTAARQDTDLFAGVDLEK